MILKVIQAKNLDLPIGLVHYLMKCSKWEIEAQKYGISPIQAMHMEKERESTNPFGFHQL